VITLEIELKRCPFCGGEAEIKLTGNSIVGYSKVEVRCHICGMGRTYGIVKGMSSDTIRSQVAKKWNRRADDEV
jgi:Lar family restriction alleviation protein